jgi:hypothetical protein
MMATKKYPNQNVKMPMDKEAVDAARARAMPQGTATRAFQEQQPTGGGSRRQTGKGEWVDDTVIEFDKPGLPSKDSPPVWDKKDERTVPGSYDPLKAYSVALGSSVEFAGRMLAPGKEYIMKGEVCTTISASIVDAVELGDIPVEPDAQPS